MLDTDNPTNDPGPPDGPTPGRKATARKATARKASPRKVTARTAAAQPPVDHPVTPAANLSAALPADGSTRPDADASTPLGADRLTPRKATARKATVRKAAGKALAGRATPSADVQAAADFVPPTAPTPSEPELTKPVAPNPTDEAPPPRKRTSRARKVTAPELTERTLDASTAPTAPDVPAAPPGMVFVTPSEALLPAPAAPRRRRRSEPSAVASPEVVEPRAADPIVDTVEVEDPDEIREAAAEEATGARRRRRRGRRGRGSARGRDTDDTPEAVTDDKPAEDTEADVSAEAEDADEPSGEETGSTARRRRRRRRRGADGDPVDTPDGDDPPDTVVHVRDTRGKAAESGDGVRGVRGSTRLEAKRQRRRDGRESGRRRPAILTESEFLARREAVNRVMAVRQLGDRTQIAVLEDGVLVEHYVTRASSTSYVGNVYLGRVQNVLPSMEAAFIDISKGRNGVLYAGEVNWDASGLEGKSRAIESALSSGDTVLVQVTKDPIGHKGARLTSQVSLPGRFLVYVPGGAMTGVSRKLPDTERHRLKSILKKIVPEDAGVIIRTAAEGASEEDLTHDVDRLKAQWESIQSKAAKPKGAPMLVYGEPDLAIRVVRDVFNEDFGSMAVQGEDAWTTISDYLAEVAPDLVPRLRQRSGESDLFDDLRVDEQLTKALERKVFLPSGGSLVIDRTEAMTVVDVNTGKFVGSGGNLEQTVTRNNLEAAEEIVRQLRLRDVGGIVVIDFIDMVLESNRDLVLRRLTECLGRDRTKHQVAEVTSLGLVQMTRKRVGEGLLEAFSEPCPTCGGRGVLVHSDPIDNRRVEDVADDKPARRRGKRGKGIEPIDAVDSAQPALDDDQRRKAASAMAAIAGANQQDVAGTEDGLDIDRADGQGETLTDGHDGTFAEIAEPGPTTDDQPTDLVASAPRRGRRRTASRPAGPPVLVTS
ncbi:MAG: Rne/Rng family ribonuclease [Actinomycetota bacterium]